ncbi:MAG: hypothetical protein Q8R39_01160 [bacterium]|nr:hypothetical protein [bacterium]
MISPEIAQLVVELARLIGERERKKAEAEPEVCLVALLNRMRSDLREISATLGLTVEFSFFDGSLNKAREFLESQQNTTTEHRSE